MSIKKTSEGLLITGVNTVNPFALIGQLFSYLGLSLSVALIVVVVYILLLL